MTPLQYPWHGATQPFPKAPPPVYPAFSHFTPIFTENTKTCCWGLSRICVSRDHKRFSSTFLGIREGTPPNWIYYKNCVFILTWLNFSHLEYAAFHAVPLSRCFFHCSNQFSTLSILMPFSASAIFCFTSSTSAKRFPLRTFSSRKTKKSHLGQDRVNREGGTRGSGHFWSKTAEHSTCGVGRCPRTSQNGQRWWKSLQKNSLKPSIASHNNTSWHTDTDRFVEHSLCRGSLYYKGPALQKIILGFWGSPLIHVFCPVLCLTHVPEWENGPLLENDAKFLALEHRACSKGSFIGQWLKRKTYFHLIQCL